MLGGVSLNAQENGNPSEGATPLKGDLNHDLKVNMADVTYLVNLIMNKKSEDGLRQYADRPAGGYENFKRGIVSAFLMKEGWMVGNQKGMTIKSSLGSENKLFMLITY